AEGGIRVFHVTGVQTCALPISGAAARAGRGRVRRLTRPPAPHGPAPAATTRTCKDRPAAGTALAIDLALLGLFALQHSGMARPRSEERRVGKERTCQWRPGPSP